MPDEKTTFAVGVSVLLTTGTQVLMGVRKNNTAAGMLSTPGGRLEYDDESVIHCAAREFTEECGAVLDQPQMEVIGFKKLHRWGKHYIMFYVHAKSYTGEIVNTEPSKCEGWVWHHLSHLPTNCTEPTDILQILSTKL